jgi:hypothetical protein
MNEYGFKQNEVYTTVCGMVGSIDIQYRLIVKGADRDIIWQDVYRKIAKQLLDSIPALEAAGIK